MKQVYLIVFFAFFISCSQDDSNLFLETNHLEKEIEKSKKIKTELQARAAERCCNDVMRNINDVTSEISTLNDIIANPDPIHDNESTLANDRQRVKDLEQRLEDLNFEAQYCAVE